MTQTQSAEEKARLKKLWTEQAIQQAQVGQWVEAVETNRSILNLFPFEPDAYNRLGKALSELGQYTEARQAYSQTLKYNPKNAIAKKNLDRLAMLADEPIQQTHAVGSDRIDPRLFIEEAGKTGMTNIINLGAAAIARVGVGDRVQLHVIGHTVMVRNAAGEDLGQIEPHLANRLIKFMEGGNRYAAAILAMDNGEVRLIIREEYQHPSMFGRVSFPSQGGGETIRAYIKDSMLRYDREDEEESGSDDDYFDGGDEAEEIAEIDFESGVEAEE